MTTFILSAVCKNQIAALAASLAMYLFPMMLPVSETNLLFRFIVLLTLYHFQFISIMSIGQMGSGVLYSLWAIPMAAVFLVLGTIISRRVFAGHQVT